MASSVHSAAVALQLRRELGEPAASVDEIQRAAGRGDQPVTRGAGVADTGLPPALGREGRKRRFRIISAPCRRTRISRWRMPPSAPPIATPGRVDVIGGGRPEGFCAARSTDRSRALQCREQLLQPGSRGLGDDVCHPRSVGAGVPARRSSPATTSPIACRCSESRIERWANRARLPGSCRRRSPTRAWIRRSLSRRSPRRSAEHHRRRAANVASTRQFSATCRSSSRSCATDTAAMQQQWTWAAGTGRRGRRDHG